MNHTKVTYSFADLALARPLGRSEACRNAAFVEAAESWRWKSLRRRMRRPVLSMLLDVASALRYDWLLMINRPQRASARVRQPVHRLLASHDRTIDRKVAQSLCHLGESGPERGEAATGKSAS